MKNKNFPKVLLTGLFLFMVVIGFAQVPTVNTLSTTDTTPLITGTVTLGGGVLTVTVGATPYTEGADLTITGTNWSLQIPGGSELAVGTYNVAAVVVGGSNAGSDATSNELTITAPFVPDQTTQTSKTLDYAVTDHPGSTFAWVITGSAGTDYSVISGAALPTLRIKWFKPGNYTLTVTETNSTTLCNTTRDFKVTVEGDYDLRVVAWTPTNAATPWDLVGTAAGSNATAVCITESGQTITNNSAVNGNTDFTAKNVVYFKVSLYNGTDLVNAVGDTKTNWKFTLNDLSLITGAWTAATKEYYFPGTHAVTTVANPVTITDDGISEIIVKLTIDPLASNTITQTNIVQISGTALAVDPSDAAIYPQSETAAKIETGTAGLTDSNISYTYTFRPVPDVSVVTPTLVP